jgi:hypothetical protein
VTASDNITLTPTKLGTGLAIVEGPFDGEYLNKSTQPHVFTHFAGSTNPGHAMDDVWNTFNHMAAAGMLSLDNLIVTDLGATCVSSFFNI